MKESLTARLFRDSAAYTLSALLTTGLGLLLLPVYARLLDPAEFGTYDLVMATGLIVGVTVALEVTQGVLLFVPQDTDGNEIPRLVAAGFRITLAGYAVLLSVSVLLGDQLATLLAGHASSRALPLAAACQFCAVALVRYWSVVGRAQLDPGRVVRISIGAALLGAAGGVAGLLLQGGVTGLLAGQAVGQGVVAVFATVVNRRLAFAVVGTAVIRKLLTVSCPLVISSVTFIVATYVDRFFVRELLGLHELGNFALAARIAAGVGLLLVGFQSALSPLIYSQLRRPGIHEDVARVFRYFVGAAAFALVLVVLLAEWAVALLGGREYADAVPVLRLLAAAVLVQGSYIFFPGLHIAGRTLTLAAINVLAIGVNVALNPWLISVWGLTGAGVATLVAACVGFALNATLSQRHFAVPVLPWRRPSYDVDAGRAGLP